MRGNLRGIGREVNADVFVQRDLHVVEIEVYIAPQHRMSNLTLTYNWSVPTGVLYVGNS